MTFIKTTAFVLSFLLFVQCSVMKPVNKSKIEKELSEYKLMTEYIMSKNYHDDFKGTIIYGFDKAKETDSLLFDFMRRKNVHSIYIQDEFELPKDSITQGNQIEYHFFYVPIFGKRRELIFDFSPDKEIQSEKKKGFKRVVLEEGIYYVEY